MATTTIWTNDTLNAVPNAIVLVFNQPGLLFNTPGTLFSGNNPTTIWVNEIKI